MTPGAGFHLAMALAASNDSVIGVAPDGRVTSWNAGAARMFGHEAGDMLGASILRIVPPDRVAEARDLLERAARGERIARYRTERLDAAGRSFPVLLTITPVREGAASIVGISEVARDLGEVSEHEALLAAVIDTAPDGLIVADRGGIIQAFSAAAARMFGVDADDMIGRNLTTLMPRHHAEGHDAAITRYIDTGEARIIGIGRVVEAMRADGSVFPIELQVGEVRTAGAPLFTAFVRDLSERQARERELAVLQAELIHVARLSELGQMASALAHEVSQPLTAIANYVSAARRMLDGGKVARLDEVLVRIGEQGERARRIVQGLRGLVKKEVAAHLPEEVGAMIDETWALALPATRGTLQLVRADAPGKLVVCVDKVQIQQVLLNLMRNAIEAMRDAPRRVLSVTTRRCGDRVEIEVADTGPGLSADTRAHLFQPFVTTKDEGLGVGLSISRSIAEAHGGTLDLRERPGYGAVFVLSLPAFAEAVVVSDAHQGAGAPPGTS